MISSQFIQRVSLRRDTVDSFDHYPFHLPAVRSLDQLEMHPRVTFFIGENGSGKSTLLLRIARGFRRPRTGFFLRAESFFNVATEIENLDAEPGPGAPLLPSYGGRSLHEQSHGESFLALLTQRFTGQGLYILDEPEAALSPQRQLAVLARIHELVRDGSQFLIATHSPLLMAYPDACIYQCGAEGVVPVAYDDTEHVRVTRDFLANPARMLQGLLAP